MSKFLDEQGVQRLWDKTKNYVTNNKATAEIIDITDSDLDFSDILYDMNNGYECQIFKSDVNYSDYTWELLDKLVNCYNNNKHFIIKTKNEEQLGELKKYVQHLHPYHILEFNLNTCLFTGTYGSTDENTKCVTFLEILVQYEVNVYAGDVYSLYFIITLISESISLTSNDIDTICTLTDNWYKLGDDYIDKYNGTVILLPCDSENISDEEFNKFLNLMDKAYGVTNDAQVHEFMINQYIREGMTKSIKVLPSGYLGGDLYEFEYSTNGEDVYRTGHFKVKEPLTLTIGWIV